MDHFKNQTMNSMNRDEANFQQDKYNRENPKVYKGSKRKNFWLYVTLIIFIIAIISVFF
ncbi:hypothetical protein [Anaerorhabdus sp.]|uniref:hypothetical protein n=1 Tax=Anaerorhabdus sp. TaxID=1872524 RepID=UPI002FC738E3